LGHGFHGFFALEDLWNADDADFTDLDGFFASQVNGTGMQWI
jgi:hypothetical protein